MMSLTIEVTILPNARADDDTDGHVEYVASHGEILEFFQHAHVMFLPERLARQP